MAENNAIPASEFDNIQVVAIPYQDAEGKIKYATNFIPEVVEITTFDTVLNYQLIAPTPAGVKFTRVTISPDDSSQLSVPSISKSGKLVTFNDANTLQEDFNLTFHFEDADGIAFKVDPIVKNYPPV